MALEVFGLVDSILSNTEVSADDWREFLRLLPLAYQEDLGFKLLLDWHCDLSAGIGEAGFGVNINNIKSNSNFVNLIKAILKANRWNNLAEYQVFELLLLHARVNLRGKVLLEIGGCMPNELIFDDLLVKSYISVEAPDYIDAEPASDFDNYNSFHDPHPQKRTVFVKAEDLSSVIQPGSIDHIFSTACFEHIYDLPKALNEAHYCLKQNGTLYSYFAPIYSYIKEGDHHVIPLDKFENPPYGLHLLSHIDQRKYLENSGITDPMEIQQILGKINFNRIPNRLLHEDYEIILTESPLVVMEIKRLESYNLSKNFQKEFRKIRSSNTLIRNMNNAGFRIHMLKM